MDTEAKSDGTAGPAPAYNALMQRSVLIVEDDAAIRRGVVDALKFEGFHTFEAADGESGLKSALQVECDIVLLDLALPKMHGLDILKEVRRVRPTLPVIVLTAMGDEKDRVAGLKLGADDYVVKPFSIAELVARVEAENEDYAGVEDEPGRLLDWLTGHRAEIALSEEEREWLTAAIGALPEEARYASLAERFASHAFALGLVEEPEAGHLPELMSRFGFLSEELPAGLRGARIRPGREQFLG